MSTEIQLINEIEKRECLYNFNCPDYNRKEITEEAWTEVADCTDLAISDCKEKWRNIRSSFLRSLKHGGNKTKKPYYLSVFLQFLIPYLKPINQELSQQGSNDVTEPDIEIKQEVIDDDYETNEQYDVPVSKDEDQQSTATTMERHQPVRRKRRICNYQPDSRFKMRRYIIRSTPGSHKTEMSHDNSPSNPMKYFLMSLLPEFDTMDEEQIRIFKIKVMMLINDLKTDPKSKDLPKIEADSNRLQKRLINLLLKTLAKKT